jgi:GT2 family glycosyltransferase
MTGKLLVITPTLGLSEFLEESRASVEQMGAQVQHVMACPADRVAGLQRRFPACRVVADAGREGAIYGALNAALTAVPDGWDWFTYINDDDLLGPDFSSMLRTHLGRRNPEDVAYGNVRLIDERSAPFGYVTTEPNPRFLPHTLHQIMSPLNQQGMLFSRHLLGELGGFDLRYKLCADLDFWVRAYAAGRPFRYYPMEVGQFRVRAGQLSGDVGLTRREFADIVARHLPTKPSATILWLARLRYRLINLPHYLTRLRRVGWKTSEEVLSGGA